MLTVPENGAAHSRVVDSNLMRQAMSFIALTEKVEKGPAMQQLGWPNAFVYRIMPAFLQYLS